MGQELSTSAGLVTNLKSFFEKLKRVWMILKKPTLKEFKMVSKVSAIGILILGIIGFIISIIVSFFF